MVSSKYQEMPDHVGHDDAGGMTKRDARLKSGVTVTGGLRYTRFARYTVGALPFDVEGDSTLRKNDRVLAKRAKMRVLC